jgi:hypothetical protein
VEETRISQLKGELAAIGQKKTDREQKLGELTAKRNKAKADLEESLKRNEESRQDAISLTEYQKKELSEVETRQATIIKQFNADSDQLTKTIAELRTRREAELARATWNAEEARIENAYKTKMADYTNKRRQPMKKTRWNANANFSSVGDEGTRNSRCATRARVNKILKPTLVAEPKLRSKPRRRLQAVNSKRRDRVAQVDTDARRLRRPDRRSSASGGNRRKREELSPRWLLVKRNVGSKAARQEFAAAVQKKAR